MTTSTFGMNEYQPIIDDYIDVWDEWMNAVLGVAITLLGPSGHPSTQRIWVVTCDLSANGVMPRHHFRNYYYNYFFLWSNGLCTYLEASFQGSRHTRWCKELEGGGKKRTLSTYLVTCVAVSKGGRWQQLTFTHWRSRTWGNSLKKLIYLAS